MNLKGANRILVIGCSGGGKSTLTRLLAEKYGLPTVHLDIHFWNPNWEETLQEQWREKVQGLVKPDKWIMDGTFSESFDLRFPLADKIIFLDMPRLVCLWRAITRVFKYNKSKSRPDMAKGCHETFDFSFYKYIWTFKRKVNPLIFAAIEKYNCDSKLVILRSNNDVQRFYRELLVEK